MSTVPLHTWVEPWLVALSIFTAAVWSFTAIELVGRLRLVVQPAVRHRWLAAAAVALGCGVWGTQFTGMLAFRVPATVRYDPRLVAASLVLAGIGGACALAAGMPPRPGRRRQQAAALGFGAAVAAAHVVAMSAMRADGVTRRWDAAVLLASIVPATAGALGGLSLALGRPGDAPSTWRRGAGGVLLGAGIAATQYVGMSAVGLRAPAGPPAGGSGAQVLTAGLVAAVALSILGAALAQSLVHRRAIEDARVMRAVGEALREMSAGLDGRHAVCEAAQRITGCVVACLYDLVADGPPRPAATAGLALRETHHVGTHIIEAIEAVRHERRGRVVADAPGGPLLLEPVLRDGRVAAVLCLELARRTALPSRRRRAAVRLLAAEAAVAIERAELVERLRASDRTEAATRLARDLHDSVSQEVSLASWYAQLAIKAFDDDRPDARDLVVRAAEQLSRTQDEMRDVLRGLREGRRALDGEATVPELVEALAAEHARSGRCAVSVVQDGDDWQQLGAGVGEALYFAVREAINNADKHAAGADVHVGLRAGRGSVSAMVHDDGPGFDPDRIPEGRWGLLGMRERAERLGGVVVVRASAGSGTTVTVTLPRHGGERRAGAGADAPRAEAAEG
ncbi:hypothetical protein DSM104299_00326 [Baekduia alba]|uniref:MHYT domain-containing protein n=1 Tax=Baekduia alba TaxID=2997333 RepID=UPI0023400DAB|nr:MHYT domain-containing protein [Baekduia alba]WCB91653.1 hypothetical protein DSM104299_00326 [Baekduia alba]